MRILLKYIFWLLSLGMLIIYYLLGTTLGHQSLGYFLEDYLSTTTKNTIEVEYLNIQKYPHVVMRLKLNNKSSVQLEGEVNETAVDMKYHLVGESFRLNGFYLNQPVNVTGHLVGAFSNLFVDGKGVVFDGKAQYAFYKVPSHFKDINLTLKQANTQKVLAFLKQEPLMDGKVDIRADFKHFSTHKKEGNISVYTPKASVSSFMPNHFFTLSSMIEVKNMEYAYKADVTSTEGTLHIDQGVYHESKKAVRADYKLHLNNLAHYEAIFKHKYKGSLDTKGKVLYKNNKFRFEGETEKFDGNLVYVYQNQNLDLFLKSVSLVKLLKQFDYPALFTSKVYGTINYNLKEKIVLINTDLKETRFRATTMTNMIYNASGINLLSEVYDQSSFNGGYQNNILSSILKIDNGKNHLYLTDTKLNANTNQVNSNFEMKMQGEEIFGEIYGTLKEPKVSVDMSRLLKYQMNKQLSGWLGTNKEEVIKEVKDEVKEQLKELDVDDVTQKAKSLIDGFF